MKQTATPQTSSPMSYAMAKMTEVARNVYERCQSVFSQNPFEMHFWRQENALIPLIISPKRTAYSPEHRPDLHELEP